MRAITLLASIALVGCRADGSDLTPGSPYAIEVHQFTPGTGAGFGQEHMPDIVLGAPRGFGASMGSTDVLSLGLGGRIVLALGAPVTDGEGDDLIVFENAFYIGGVMAAPFIEPGIVGVSSDGVNFTEWPCDPSTSPHTGCAGVTPVIANGSVDLSDTQAAGGDRFDLADLGIAEANYVRIRDANVVTGMRANPPTAGFDLDAIVALHHR
ncbi:MAG: cell surface protein [Sandaracinaceae bacterium]|nr:cell surface protein [Sandaracinaceae bacterium]